MADLKYYAEEDKRYAGVPKGERGKLTRDEVRKAYAKLFRHFKAPPIEVQFTSGNRFSHFSVGRRHIRINMDWADWHTVAHEMAHYLDHLDREKKVRALTWNPTGTQEQAEARTAKVHKIRNRLWHGKVHARFTDKVFRYVQKKDWENGSLRAPTHQASLDPAAITAEQAAEAYAAAPESAMVVRRKDRQDRIAHREAQVARLAKKVKALTTRLKRAQRSLAALRRAEAKSSAALLGSDPIEGALHAT